MSDAVVSLAGLNEPREAVGLVKCVGDGTRCRGLLLAEEGVGQHRLDDAVGTAALLSVSLLLLLKHSLWTKMGPSRIP